MKASSLPVLALLLLLWGSHVQAQSNALFEQKTQEKLTVSSFQNPELGAMAAELGRTNTHRSGKLLLPVEFEQQLRVVREGAQVKIEASAQKFWVPEKVLYLDFDFADALTPTTISAKIQLLGPEGKVLQLFEVQNKSIAQSGKTMLVQTSLQDTTSFDGYKLKVVEQKVGFTHANQSAVRERADLVQRYYASDARLAQLALDLQTVNPTDIDRLTSHNNRLKALESELNQLVDARMEQKLDLAKTDPVQLKRKIRDLDRRFRERRVVIDQTWARLPEIFYSRGVELALNGNSRAARDFFERSLKASPAFAPSHLQLARLDLKEGYLTEAAQRTKEILNRLQPDPETFRFAQELALNVQNEYIQYGEQLNNQGKYAQALQQFEAARDYCRSITSLRCRPELWESGIAFAKGGIYDQLLQDGRLALKQNLLPEATKKANEAQQYARNNRTALESDAAAQNLILDIQERVYQNTMVDGRKALQAKQYAAALIAFDNAKSVAVDFKLTPQPDAEALIRQAAKPVLLEKIADGQQYASLNQLAQARTTAAQVNNLQLKYGLVNDPELDVNFRALSQAIFSQACANAQTTYHQHYQRSLQYSAEGNYAQAAAELDKAIAAANGNAGCSISSATAEAELTRIDAPAHYQELLQKVNSLVAQNKPAEAVQVYQQAGTHFTAGGVAPFGLQHASVVAFALQQTDKNFIAEVTRFAAAHATPTDAIALIRRLANLKLAKFNLNKLQTLVGETLAIRDAQANPSANYKQLAASYTGGTKDLKKLGKAYEKKFKKLT